MAKSNKFTPAENVGRMKASSTMKAAQAAAILREQGLTVIDLSVGEPDFDTPEFIKDYAREGLSKGLTKYTPSSGMKQFRESVSVFYERTFGANVSTEEIAAACGGKQALFNAACTLLDPGDEVMIPSPYWVTFPEISEFCRAKNVFLDTSKNNFVLNADLVRSAISEKTKLLILNSPNNPTGRVIPRIEMQKIAEVCAENNVYILTDECYLFFAYPPSEPYSMAVLPEDLRKFICVAGSFSKTFAMTGWRSGYTIAPVEWTKEIVKLQSHSATHPTSFVQYACSMALNDERSMQAVRSMLSEYKRRRDWLIPALNDIDGIKCEMPDGAFYAFIDVREMLGDRFGSSADITEYLLENAQVVMTDGSGFGADGFIRISYATSMENLHSAVEKMKAALKV